jgi:isoleucyl-tRNA synthetase
MEKTREITASALSKRAEEKIRVRQPLSKLQIADKDLQKEKELLDLIKEEVNVKKITFGRNLELDVKLTPKLKEEGVVREIVRNLQEMRKEAGLQPKDRILIRISGETHFKEILSKNKKFILEETLADDLKFEEKAGGKLTIGKEVEMDGKKLQLGIRKV